MNEHQERIDLLYQKLENLALRQNEFDREIGELRREIDLLKRGLSPEKETVAPAPEQVRQDQPRTVAHQAEPAAYRKKPSGRRQTYKTPDLRADMEKFIGENLINKIGIAILVIGVGIGAKYSIEHDLISPLTRIILGYLSALGLLATGMKLKKNYESYSAVLVSGAMAIMYFITYIAYAFYALIPQIPTFVLMTVFTAFTVLAALKYNRAVIAHIGLVGAYAVPFLLSDGSGRVAILFSYMVVINIGILVIAFRKNWKSLYYTAFLLSWLIYGSWFVMRYDADEHFGLALLFSSLFFILFYITLLAYVVPQKLKPVRQDIMMLLGNAFVFYGFGYDTLGTREGMEQLLGLFTLVNALIHFTVSAGLFRKKAGDKNLFYLISGLVLVFIAIAIPVQLDGNWVTLLWAGEAALMFWIGRKHTIALYEKLSYPLMLLAFLSIIHDWNNAVDLYAMSFSAGEALPVLNVRFLSSLLFASAFGFITWLDQKEKDKQLYPVGGNRRTLLSIFIATVFLISLYNAFRIEIINYWNRLYLDSALTPLPESGNISSQIYNEDLTLFRNIWVINYTLFFTALLSLVNIKKLRHARLGVACQVFNGLALLVFLTIGLDQLSQLRLSYLQQPLSEYYHYGVFHIAIRYISLVFAALALYAIHLGARQEFMKRSLIKPVDIFIHGVLLWIASSELINWMEIASVGSPEMLGLSILWGLYSLLLIVLGIWKKKKHLRIAAMVVFAVTILKLLFYDLATLDTIAKTIVLVTLGLLLLISSFLYNKYKNIIAEDSHD